MNPRLVLSLWRERWGKTADAPLHLPYLKGTPNAWADRLSGARLWSLPAASYGILFACMAVFVWILSSAFAPSGQAVFAMSLAGFALYLRRYKGTLITLTLLGLALLASGRYLYWRFTATLGHGFNSDFLMGFGLCVAELHLWAVTMLGFLQWLWPLKHAPAQLPKDQDKWPTVDVYIPIQGHDRNAVLQRCTAALTLDWPKERLRVYLLDGAAREDLRSLAASIGVAYLECEDQSSEPSVHILQAFSRTTGELAAIFDGDKIPQPDFLQQAVGWFLRDPTLATLQTPKSISGAQSAKHHQPWIRPTATTVSCAVVRRAMGTDFYGTEPQASITNGQMAQRLQAAGLASGYIGFNERPVLGASLFRIDHRLSGAMLARRQMLGSMRSMLQFYLPLAYWVFLTAPLAYLLFGVQLIQTRPELFVAYAIPHLLHGYIAHGRLRGSERLGLWADLRDSLLAWYMLLPTAVSVVRTEINQFLAPNGTRKAAANEPFHWTHGLAYSIVLILNLVGVAVGLSQLQVVQASGSIDSIWYVLWCACNLMILTAILAVAEESRHIRLHTKSLSRMPAMIQLPSGHALSCETQDYPQTTLTLAFPMPPSVVDGSQINVSIFCTWREFDFPAQVVSHESAVVRIRIDNDALARYRAVSALVLSRTKDWPQWLPARSADHPLPVWLSRPIEAALLRARAFVGKLDKTVRNSQLGRWIQHRKTKT